MIRRLDTASPELAAIHGQCFDHPWSTGVFTDLATKRFHRIYAAEEEGMIVSFIVMSVVAGEGEILTFATDPSRQKQGHGRRLLGYVISALRDEDQESLFLEVAVDNGPALSLYTACGFERTGLRKAYYARKGSMPVDGHMLRLALKQTRP